MPFFLFVQRRPYNCKPVSNSTHCIYVSGRFCLALNVRRWLLPSLRFIAHFALWSLKKLKKKRIQWSRSFAVKSNTHRHTTNAHLSFSTTNRNKIYKNVCIIKRHFKQINSRRLSSLQIFSCCCRLLVALRFLCRRIFN